MNPDKAKEFVAMLDDETISLWLRKYYRILEDEMPTTPENRANTLIVNMVYLPPNPPEPDNMADPFFDFTNTSSQKGVIE